MQLNKKECFNKGEYGYFVKKGEKQPKIYAGLYNKDRDKVFLISENKVFLSYSLVDLLVEKNGANNIKIYHNTYVSPSLIGCFIDKFNYYFNNVYYKNESISNVRAFYKKDFKDDYGQNKYPDYSCTVKLLLENEKRVNKAL